MIKLVIFDLDGVIVDASDIHYKAFNEALVKYGYNEIKYDEHLKKYNGLSSKIKLDKLLIPKNQHDNILKYKQQITSKLLQYVIPNQEILKIIDYIKKNNIRVWICSNSISETIKNVIDNMKLNVDGFLSNEDVQCPKPNSEIYFKCMSINNIKPQETLIFEDSLIGINSAIKSGAYVYPVYKQTDLTLNLIKELLNTKLNNQILRKVYIPKLTIIIPMAGLGSRFYNKGYTDPKPFIKVDGKYMIQKVIDNIGIVSDNYIFIMRKEHEEYMDKFIKELKNVTIIYISELTEGAACTILKAEEYMNPDDQLLLVNSDQYLEWDPFEFLLHSQNFDGCISVFKETENSEKWSYAKIDENGLVESVSEKKRISEFATTGVYYYKYSSDFIKCAKQMIDKKIKVNNEYYTCPVYNEAILNGLKIGIKLCDKMWSLGTPEDLDYYNACH